MQPLTPKEIHDFDQAFAGVEHDLAKDREIIAAMREAGIHEVDIIGVVQTRFILDPAMNEIMLSTLIAYLLVKGDKK